MFHPEKTQKIPFYIWSWWGAATSRPSSEIRCRYCRTYHRVWLCAVPAEPQSAVQDRYPHHGKNTGQWSFTFISAASRFYRCCYISPKLTSKIALISGEHLVMKTTTIIKEPKYLACTYVVYWRLRGIFLWLSSGLYWRNSYLRRTARKQLRRRDTRKNCAIDRRKQSLFRSNARSSIKHPIFSWQ